MWNIRQLEPDEMFFCAKNDDFTALHIIMQRGLSHERNVCLSVRLSNA